EDEPSAAGRETVPREVEATINRLVDSYRKRWAHSFGDASSIGERSQASGWIYSFRAPRGRQLFLFQLVNPLGFTMHFPIVHDPKGRASTRIPPTLWGKWTDIERDAIASGRERPRCLEKPLIAFDDLDRDGQPEIVIEEVVHNGTMYNGVVYHYFH